MLAINRVRFFNRMLKIGEVQNEIKIKHAYEQMLSILQATADGSLYEVDPNRSDEIPPRGSYYYKDLPPEELSHE